MTGSQENIRQLIIRQRPAADSELDAMLLSLQQEFGLDNYSARQRLIGPGLAYFGKGRRDKTERIAACLQDHGYACWSCPPVEPRFAPDRMRGLEIFENRIRFDCQQEEIYLNRGDAAVCVLADLSGGLIDKHLQRLLAQNTYRGQNALQALGQDEMIQTIYRGQPVFDCYILEADNGVRQAFRVLAGRFNIEGLGGRAGMSTTQNLQAMVRLVEEYADPCRVHYDFGLAQLPKCRVERLSDNPSATINNLASLTYYGWLVAGLHGDGLVRPDPSADSVVAGAPAVAVLGQPAFGTVVSQVEGDDELPDLTEVVPELRTAVNDKKDPGTRQPEPRQAAKTAKDLPPPPERPTRRFSLRRGLALAGMAGGGLLGLLAGAGQFDLIGPLVHYGTAAGVFPGLFAAGLFWGGFYFIRLKRRVENTPTSKVRSIAMGMVEVHGRARRLYALVAPMTQSPCIFYRLRKYRRERNNRWKLVREMDSRHVPFQVDDGTGRVTVDPTGAFVRAKTRQTGYPGDSPLTFTAFRREYEDEKWTEELVFEGTSLYVLGYAYPFKEQRQTLHERTATRLRELKLDHRALYSYDTDGDGRIDQAEWDAARSDAEQKALKEQLAERNERKRQEDHLVIARPRQKRLPFVIAETISEAHLTRRYGLISFPLLLAGLVAAGFAVYKFLEYFSF